MRLRDLTEPSDIEALELLLRLLAAARPPSPPDVVARVDAILAEWDRDVP